MKIKRGAAGKEPPCVENEDTNQRNYLNQFQFNYSYIAKTNYIWLR